MMTVNKIRVRNLAEAGLSHAVVLEKILSNQPKMLSAILIGNNIVNISASSLMTVLVTDVLGNKYVGIGTGVLTLLVLIFGEITPKTSATIYSETLSLKFAKPIYLIMQVLTPLIVVVDMLSKGVLKMIHVDPNKKQDAITEDELRTIVEVSHGRQPCWKLDHRFGARDVMTTIIKTGRAGLYFRVIREGEAEAGWRMDLIDRPLPEWSMARVFQLLIGGGHRADPAAVRALAAVTVLADAWRVRAEKLSGW